MAGINKVILVGNLGKDPEIRSLESGVKVATFSLATTESYKNKEGQKVDNTEWHNIVLWRNQAEFAEKFLKKGQQIYLEGKIRSRSWEDKDGNKKFITEILGDNIMPLGARREEVPPPPPPPNIEADITPSSTSTPGPDDDLPF